MRFVALVLAPFLVGCGSTPAPAAPASHPAASGSATLPTSPAEGAAAHSPAASAAASAPGTALLEAPLVAKRPTAVAEGKCAGQRLLLDKIVGECACTPVGYRNLEKLAICPGRPPELLGAAIPDLRVTLTVAEPKVTTGDTARVTVSYENQTDAAMPLHFLRTQPLEVVFLAADGQKISPEGTDLCERNPLLVALAGVTLGPHGVVVAEVPVPAKKRRHGVGKDACKTMEGSKLRPGKYRIGIAESPLFGAGQTTTAEVEVVAR